MTQETMRDLQVNTLIGMTAQRGNAWHRRDDLRKNEDGTYMECNHYEGFIPVADVQRRLFNWLPQSLEVAYLKPCEVDEADFITAQGVAVKVIESQAARRGVLRDDTGYDLGIFKTAIHQSYGITLIQQAERLTGSVLGISSAGLLAKGGRAWVEFSLPETLHDAKSGFDYRPNLLKADSMDGSISQTSGRTINATVCDNTLSWNLLEANKAGVLFRRKHTRNFADFQDERDALGILEATNEEFVSELHALLDREVTTQQVGKVLDIVIPIPEDEGRARTVALNKRDRWWDLYTSDDRCAPWQGTAFGAVQTNNTWDHWLSQIQGSRSERNTWRAIKGEQAESDRKFVAALESVLG